jgi:hypothetical protein
MTSSYAPDEEPDTSLLEDENPDIRREIIDTVGEEWLVTKNAMLDNRAPQELIGTREEFHLRNMLRSFISAALS